MALGSKIIEDPALGKVLLVKKRRTRRISIRVSGKTGVTVSLPWLVPYATGIAFLEERREWALAALEKEKRLNLEVETMRAQAKQELPPRLAALAERYGFKYNRVTIKFNRTNWGSCSSLGNINLTLQLVKLPPLLQDYIMLHELCHLKHMDHSEDFHILLEDLLKDHVGRLAAEGYSPAATLLTRAAASRARYPITQLMIRALNSLPRK